MGGVSLFLLLLFALVACWMFGITDRDSGNVGRDSGNIGRDSGNIGRDSGNIGHDSGNVGLVTSAGSLAAPNVLSGRPMGVIVAGRPVPMVPPPSSPTAGHFASRAWHEVIEIIEGYKLISHQQATGVCSLNVLNVP
jgi:hypothetical protein